MGVYAEGEAPVGVVDVVKVSKRELGQHLAAIGFLMLYPVFFFYHAAIAFGYIAPLLGGLYGLCSLIVALFYVISLAVPDQDSPSQAHWIKELFFIFVVWSVFWISLNYAANSEPDVGEASTNLFNFVSQLIANFAIGFYLSLIDTKWFKIALLTFLLCMLVFVLLAFDPGTLSVHGALYYGWAQGLADPNSFATYQEFARSTMLTSFVLLAITKQLIRRLLITAITTTTLFLLAARSEIVGFISAVAVLEILFSLKRPGRIFVFAALGFVLAILASFLGDVSGSRVLALNDLGRDTSWQSRKELTDRAIAQIMDNPLFGKFGGDHDEGTGEGGNYAHNILSAWVSLGLPGFLLYLSLLLGSFFCVAQRAFATKSNSDLWNLALLTSITALLLSFFAKSVSEAWFGLVFGLVLNVAREEWQSSQERELSGPLCLRSAAGDIASKKF
jgi:hypothetical protein